MVFESRLKSIQRFAIFCSCVYCINIPQDLETVKAAVAQKSNGGFMAPCDKESFLLDPLFNKSIPLHLPNFMADRREGLLKFLRKHYIRHPEHVFVKRKTASSVS